MLCHTFCHLPGIGRKTEQRLWALGIRSWEEWQDPAPVRLPTLTRIDAPELLAASRAALTEDPHFFTQSLPGSELWRIFPHFRKSTAYLDIETTGLADDAAITTIALYDGETVRVYVNGQNLNDFVDDIAQFQLIISYNGRSFDVPFLERFFGIRLGHAHLDLRHTLARLGFSGGLKGCERQLGLHRGSLDGVDGSFAVLLWHRYQTFGDNRALETLLAYNIEDTVNLERLAVEAYNRNLSGTPFASELLIPLPSPPPNLYAADSDLVAAIRQHLRNESREQENILTTRSTPW